MSSTKITSGGFNFVKTGHIVYFWCYFKLTGFSSATYSSTANTFAIGYAPWKSVEYYCFFLLYHPGDNVTLGMRIMTTKQIQLWAYYTGNVGMSTDNTYSFYGNGTYITSE